MTTMETGEPRPTGTTSEPVKEPTASSSNTSSVVPDDGDSATDEVKVYGQEEDDERETKVFEGGPSRNRTIVDDDEKATLLTEADKEPRRPDLAFPSRLFDPSLSALGIQQYILNSHAHAAYAALSLSRPSFWENALSSPGSTGAHTGLRPPLYHLPPPPPHGQYPYPMLPDQLAAWHNAAAYHQAGALRAGSPYSLPITSGTMSRFSPGGLLGHPGLSPASNGGPHLPHIKPDLDSSSSNSQSNSHRGGHHHGEKESKKKENHIKKPLNAFMLYMKEMRPVVQAECTLKESAAINQILGRRWHDLSREEQARYYEKARTERQKHMEMYPNWNARDNYRFGLKKKKRKRDKADDPAASMKKCRARYGLDQQDSWCRPCRRKKKCIRVQQYMDSKTNGGASGSGASSGGVGPRGPSAISENGAGQSHHGKSRSSDGEDDDDDDDDDHSPDSRSLGSTSEQSLTSPAGFSSLNSLGSPASIASPSTPSQFEAVVSQADLFRPSVFGAFKPPSTSAAPGAGGLGPHHHLMMQQHQQQQQHFLQQQQQMFQHMNHHRPPVGTDPRDSKNPLSISQLTSSWQPPVGPPVGPPTDKRALPLMT